MKMMLKVSTIAAILLFVGCGGDSTVSKKINKIDDIIDEASDKIGDIVKDELIHSIYVRGIYDISDNDKVYLSIEKSGLVSTYEFNNEKNCYLKNPTNFNDDINGKKLSIDESKNRFYIDKYNWIYSDSKNINKVSINGELSSLGLLSLSNGNKKFRIATSSKLMKDITKDKLEKSLCN